MKTHLTRLSAAALLVLAASCAPEPKFAEEPGLSQRIDMDYGYMVDDKGNWRPKVDKRSSFERQGDSQFTHKTLSTPTLEKKSAITKSWDGSKTLDLPEFAKKDASVYGSGNSHENGKGSRYTGMASNVTGDIKHRQFGTKSARETDVADVEKKVDAATQNRREGFVQPEIIDYRQQRDLSVKDSKDMLGR
ncbi:MAG TPA: hypothetical protein VFY13_02540 [Luteolibacter sp.]|nr:hypothetical protein [Luteolibacter sp.]